MPREYNAHGWWRPAGSTGGWNPPDPVPAPDSVGGWWRWFKPSRTDERSPVAPDWRWAGYRVPKDPRIPPPLYRWDPAPFWWWHPDQEMVETVKAIRLALGLPFPVGPWLPPPE
jgi:hypothetical protein